MDGYSLRLKMKFMVHNQILCRGLGQFKSFMIWLTQITMEDTVFL
jgi:hypothetical protein